MNKKIELSKEEKEKKAREIASSFIEYSSMISGSASVVLTKETHKETHKT